ncbi:MAG: endonuclease V [Chloroflexi bacterium]|nr:endonuclease V [Chloroflexota bacterium]MCY4248684.1 endonuclease V [Chloroflexota bacterium]
MKIADLHSWRLSPTAAVSLQRDLAQRLVDKVPLDLRQVRQVAGVDVSVRGGLSRAAVVVMRLPRLEIIETARAVEATRSAYMPGLLAFREGPVALAALRQLNSEPDVFLFDGMGQIHPRRMGIAAHLGLWLGRPTIGCGKSHYIGDYQPPADLKGARSRLVYRGEELGVVLRTRAKVKPIYVSVGHLADMETAVELVLRCTTRFRLPEPIRAAHKAAALSPR